MKRLFLFGCLSVFCFTLYSQKGSISDQVNILQKTLPSSNGQRRVDVLNRLAEFASQSPHANGWKARGDSQSYYAKIALKEASQLNYQKGIATALVHQGSAQWLYAIPLIQGKKQAKEIKELLKKGEEFLLKGIAVAEQLKDNNLLGLAYEALSLQYELYDRDMRYKLTNFEKAVHYFNKANNKAKEGEVSTWLCENYGTMGRFEQGFPYCKKSMELSESALKTAKTKEEKEYRVFLAQQAIVNLGLLHQTVGDYQSAKDYFLKSRQVGFTNGSKWSMDAELAEVYTHMGTFDSALYHQARVVPSQPSNQVYVTIGHAYILVEMKDYDKAIVLLQEYLDNYRKGKSTWRVLLPLAKAYVGKRNYAEALTLAQESMNKLGQNQGLQMMRHYKVLADAYQGVNRFDSAYYFQTRYYELRDSIMNRPFLWQLNNYKKAAIDARKAEAYALLQRDYLFKEQQLREHTIRKEQAEALLVLLYKDNKIKDQQLLIADQQMKLKEQLLNEQLLTQKQKQSELMLLDREAKLNEQRLRQETLVQKVLLGGLLLLLVVSALIVRALSLKQKNDRLQSEKRQARLQQQSSELEMQALRAQMNPHFIFNCLSSINKFILKHESKAASDYLTRFSRLIRRVLTNSQLSMIPLSDEIEMLKLYLDMERLRFDGAFDYDIVYANSIEPDMIYLPPMLLQPFCENAIWHGLMHKEAPGHLAIVMRIENEALHCVITDNGVGRARAREIKKNKGEQHTSFGLKITQDRLALFNGSKLTKNYYHMEDILDEEGRVAGTKVSLVVNYKESVHLMENA
ncbi:histidine kinase [Flavisolibacter sp. BT320]|nr:histidine kinase [Flavisolibacter longurius]